MKLQIIYLAFPHISAFFYEDNIPLSVSIQSVLEYIPGFSSSPPCAHILCCVTFQSHSKEKLSVFSWLLAITYLTLTDRIMPLLYLLMKRTMFPTCSLAIAMRRTSPGSCCILHLGSRLSSWGSPDRMETKPSSIHSNEQKPSNPNLDQWTSNQTKAHDPNNYLLLYDANILWFLLLLLSNITVPVTSQYPG